MTEQIFFDKNRLKAEQYALLLPQIEAVIKTEKNAIANIANIMAILKYCFNFFWVGVYFVESEDELVLGPFQGTLACSRIQKGKGVCGKAWEMGKTIIVPDVDDFPGHIACSSLSKSEIVVPVFDPSGKVTLVIDIDSELPNSFDENDQKGLERIALLIQNIMNTAPFQTADR